MSLTTAEAAERLGIAPATVRRWVMKGWLHPIIPSAKPLTFREHDVARARADRLTAAQHADMDATWAEVRRQAS